MNLPTLPPPPPIVSADPMKGVALCPKCKLNSGVAHYDYDDGSVVVYCDSCLLCAEAPSLSEAIYNWNRRIGLS